MTPTFLVSLLVAVFPGLMALAAVTDLMTMTIPNAIPLTLALGYVALAAPLGLAAGQALAGLACGAAVLAIGFLMFSRNWIGGGDAKFAAAIAVWLGFGALGDFALEASIGGGLLTLAILALRAVPLPAALARQRLVVRLRRPDAGVPYGIALAAAGLLQFPHSPLWRAALA